MKTPQVGDIITIYTTTEFFGSVKKHEGKYCAHGRRPYAQYSAAPFVDWVNKGKRNPSRILKGYRPFILILAGDGHPIPDDGMVAEKSSTPGLECSRSRYGSFDERYMTDFNALINPYLEAHPECVIADYRCVKEATTPEAEPQPELENA